MKVTASSERVQVRAPRVAPADLWKLSADDFNAWRRANDFPRIVAYLQKQLVQFQEWQTTFGVTDEHLVEFGPGRFLRDTPTGFVHIYDLEDSSGKRSRTLASLKHETGAVIGGDKILSRHDVQPYLGWSKRNRIRPHPLAHNHTLSVALWSQPASGPGRVSAWLLKELELLYLGGLQLGPPHLIGGRLLEFTCIDDLVFGEGAISNSSFRLWYASARRLTIKEDLAFVDGHATSLDGIQVEGSTLQDWTLSECLVAGTFRASTLFRWRLTDTTFRPFFDNTDFRECHFRHRAKTSVDLTHAIEQYGTIKRALSSRGRYAEAGEYYYLEQCLLRKRLSSPLAYFAQDFPVKREFAGTWADIAATKARGQFSPQEARAVALKHAAYYVRVLVRPWLWPRVLKYWSKYVVSMASWLWWGYGERPARALAMSVTVMLLWAGGYCFWPGSATEKDTAASLYYSIVTFATLGYGDIAQRGPAIRLFSAAEALIGAVSFGLMVAGFANKSRY
jgi:hypothetical protein